MNQSKKRDGRRQLHVPGHGESRLNPKQSRITADEERIGLDIVLRTYIEQDRADV